MYIVYRLLGPVDPSFRALSGRLKFTVRRYQFNKESLSGGAQISVPFTLFLARVILDVFGGNEEVMRPQVLPSCRPYQIERVLH